MNVTLGQYFPGHSLTHRTDPRVKLVLEVLFIAELFMVKRYAGFLLMGALLALVVHNSKIPLWALWRGLRRLLLILAFTSLLNLFYTDGRELFTIWRLTATWEGLHAALFTILRISMLIVGTSLLTFTTSPIMLTDALERLLAPLKKLRVPVGELAMMMTIALRFIPVLSEETAKIMSAQKARGADFESGSVFQRARALIPILVPLFVSAFRRADELAVAMECRCYDSAMPRSRLKEMRMKRADYLILTGMLLLIPAILMGTNRLWI
ncbi:MAG: energy-coupling factor transporter transmembrane protein EcfT [Clostridiales bacterium]|nr:energy-coupling factor transporter transmembrane protein EcfT [Clostridiales bacterium]